MSEFWRHASMPWLESRYSQASTACYGKHSHPTVSIGLIEAGSATLDVDGCSIAIGPGDLVTFNAGQVHACNPRANTEWSYHMLYFDLKWWQTIVAELSGDTGVAKFPSPVVPSADLCAGLRQINCALRRASEPEINRLELELLSWINWLLSELVTSERDLVFVERPPWMEAAKSYIKEHARETIKLDKLCQLAGLSKGALIRQFKQHTGLTPYAYLQNFRINNARMRLKNGAVISDLAHELGFADQSHLNRLFKRLVASTPGQYQSAFSEISRS